MAKTQILDYYIHLTDKDRVDTLNAQLEAGGGSDVGALIYNPNTGKYGVYRAPYAAGPPEGGAAVEFQETTTLPRIGTVDTFVTPCLKSDWFNRGFQTDVATFLRSSGWWLFGSSTRFYWSGSFVYSAKATDLVDTGGSADTDGYIRESANMPQRNFVDGFEDWSTGEGSATASIFVARAASRSLNGYGGAFRRNSASSMYREHQYSPTRTETWERFYIRLRRAPDVAAEVYQAKYAGTNPGGMFLYVTPGRGLDVYSNNGGGFTNIGSCGVTLALNTYACVDVHVYYNNTGSNVGEMRVWVNKAYCGKFTFVPGGLAGNCRHSASMCGRSETSTISTIEIDYDDWISATAPDWMKRASAYSAASTYVAGDVVSSGSWDAASSLTPFSCRGTSVPMNWIAKQAVPVSKPPTDVANKDYWHLLTPSPDFLVGSHIENVRGTAFGTGHGAWGAAVVQQFWTRQPNTSSTDVPSSTVALDPIVVDLDLAHLRKVPGQIGMGAMGISVWSHRGTTSGQLGYDVGAGAVMTALTELASLTPAAVFYTPAASSSIPALPSTLRAKYIKGNDVGTARVKSLRANVELIGTFGQCDITDGADTPAIEEVPGYHNAPYLYTPWSRTVNPPLGPVVIKSGSYVGNGTVTELTFPAPVHFLYIRNAAGGTNVPSMWWPGMSGAGHIGFHQGASDEFLNRIDVNPDYVPATPSTDDQQTECRITITGAAATHNAAATTYEYVAIMDPAHRYLLAGAVHHQDNTLPLTDTLEDPDFLPEVGFWQKVEFSTTVTVEAWWKMLGTAANGAQKLGATAEATPAITFGTGQVTYDSGFITATATFQQIAAFLLLRRHDGNGDANESSLFQVGSYVGDGTASRTISLQTSGKRPLFAIVMPTTAVAATVRDPSHTGVTSSTLTSGAAVASTGITGGGIDSLSVGSALNTNAVTYNYFVIMGSATAGNGGFSTDGTFTPVASDSVGTGNDEEPTFPETETDEEETVVDPGDLTTDIATDCVSASTRLVNIALQRIGVTVKLSSLATDTTQEAESARLIYKTELDATLRDFPWPFAKRYATLTLVDGSADDPVNGDWDMSYRLPSDYVFARRIVNPDDQRGFSRSPIPYEVTSDATGNLLYANEPGTILADDSDVVLEYTARLDCPASKGDAIFRSAAAWRLAAALVAPCARDVKLVDYCEKRYQLELARARTMHAREKEEQHLESAGDAEWIDGR